MHTTKTKSTWSGLPRFLAIFQLLLILILFSTQTSFSCEKNEKANKVFFKGNEIELGELKVIPYGYRSTLQLQRDMFMYAMLPDSVPVAEIGTGNLIMVPVFSDTMPVAINGKPIFAYEQQYTLPDANTKYTAPVFNVTASSFEEYIFSKLKYELDKLEDGSYTLNVNRIVIDDKGTLAYYEPNGIDLFMPSNEMKPIINDNIRNIINQKIIETLEEGISFKPALKDGKPVNTRIDLQNYLVVVKGHKARLVERGGC